MRKLFIKSLLLSLPLFGFSVFGQENTKSFDFKKGEVVDVMLLTGRKEVYKKLFSEYKKDIYPIGYKYSYESQGGFKIKKLTLGNHISSSFLFGKWDNITKREKFLKEIVKLVPDFHKRRRALFLDFGLTYYEVKNDLNFSVNLDKFNVVTSFWVVDSDIKNIYDIFYKSWKKSIEKNGGKIILKLSEGISPTGYYYNPIVLSIVEWENERQFQNFVNKYPETSYERLKDIHQFVI